MVESSLTIAAAAIGRGSGLPSNLWQRARVQFWPSFGILAAAKVFTAIVLLSWSSILTSSALDVTALASFRAIMGFILTTCVLTVIHIVTAFAIPGAVIDGQSAGTAIREGWALTRARWLVTAEVTVLLSGAHMAAILAFNIGSFLVSLPFILLGGIGIAHGVPTLVAIAVAGRVVSLILLFLVTLTVITAFFTAAWTLLWVRLTSPGPAPEPWLRRILR
jgi:hypothetical protein